MSNEHSTFDEIEKWVSSYCGIKDFKYEWDHRDIQLNKVLRLILGYDHEALLIWTWCFINKMPKISRALLRWGRKRDEKSWDYLHVFADECEALGLPVATYFQIWLAGGDPDHDLHNRLLKTIIKETENNIFRVHGGTAWAPRKSRKNEILLIDGFVYKIRDCYLVDKPNKRKIVLVYPYSEECKTKPKKGTRITKEDKRKYRQTINYYKSYVQGDLLISLEQRHKSLSTQEKQGKLNE